MPRRRGEVLNENTTPIKPSLRTSPRQRATQTTAPASPRPRRTRSRRQKKNKRKGKERPRWTGWGRSSFVAGRACIKVGGVIRGLSNRPRVACLVYGFLDIGQFRVKKRLSSCRCRCLCGMKIEPGWMCWGLCLFVWGGWNNIEEAVRRASPAFAAILG